HPVLAAGDHGGHVGHLVVDPRRQRETVFPGDVDHAPTPCRGAADAAVRAVTALAVRTAVTTPVRVTLAAIAVGITPLPARYRFSCPHTRPSEAHTLVPSSARPARTVPVRCSEDPGGSSALSVWGSKGPNSSASDRTSSS